MEQAATWLRRDGIAVESVLPGNKGERVSTVIAQQAEAARCDIAVRRIRSPRGVGRQLLGARADPVAKLASVPAPRESHQAAAERVLMGERGREKGGRHEGSRWIVHAALGLALLPASAAALEHPNAAPSVCATEASSPHPAGTLNLRIDNDLFGGMGQDQGYSNGFLVSWVSPNLVDYQNDRCLPALVRGFNHYLARIQPEGLDEQNMTVGLAQTMYTPTDRERRDLIVDDRPYAGVLMLSLGYNARSGDSLHTSQLRFGVVGPAAYAAEVQNAWHRVIGVDRFRGWDNQLHNEPVVQLIHERRTRVARQEHTSGWGWDLTRHWGASLGNFATYANFGGEVRFGLRLPDDLGTAPLRPAGENTSPVRQSLGGSWNAHLFTAIDARAVLYDITLDGNAFRSSHSVNKRPFVADVGYGLAFTHEQWRIAFARYHRTREFRGQREIPVYGTITVGRRF